MSDVIGRDAEIRAGDAFLDRLADGPAVLVLEGAAGIGKTTVWAAVAERATILGYRILTARPTAAEAELTLSALGDLLGTIPSSEYESLPEPQRRALDAALLRTDAGAGSIEGRVLGTAIRSLLADQAGSQPVLVAIDDIQWVDPSSATAIGYAARRLGGARVGILASHRTGEATAAGLSDLGHAAPLERIDVGPLSVAAMHHVLSAQLHRPPSRSTLVRVHQASMGNPFFALEIMRLLTDVGEPPPGDPLPVPADVQALVRDRVSRLPDATREALLALAATGGRRLDSIASALGRDPAPDLEVAIDEAVARRDGSVISFQHPLFGTAIYGLASAEARQAIHRRLARALGGSEEGARHAALAASGPDESTAAALEAAAKSADARAAPAAAASLLELALRLTPPELAEARERRSLDLAGIVVRAGDPGAAIAIHRRLVAESASPAVRVRARLALAGILFDIGTGTESVELATAALAEPIDDPQLEAQAHATLAAVSWDDFRRREAHSREANRLLERIKDPDPLIAGLAMGVKAGLSIETIGGRLDPADIKRGLELERLAARPSVSDRFSAALGVWLKMSDHLERARPWLERTYQASLDEGDEGSLAYALSHLPQLEVWTGHLPRAEDYARRHLAVSTDLELEAQRRQALYNLALVHAQQGRLDEARAEIDEALEAAASDGDRWTPSIVLPVLALLELSIGDAASAAAHLRTASDIRDEIGDDGLRRSDGDLVEALAGAGDLAAAHRALDEAKARALRHDRHSALANVARAGALLAAIEGDLDTALSLLDDALTEHTLVDIPFDRARTLLALGQVRRRRRERGLARDALREAVAIFDRIGARVWAERARVELGNLGLRRSSGDELTDGERRVAELAATGMTNREVAGALFMSPKTVEAHLARAYQKLGISSRAELGAVIGRAGSTPDSLQT